MQQRASTGITGDSIGKEDSYESSELRILFDRELEMGWHNQNTYGFLRTSQEAQDNADMVYNILYSLGWKKAAICAMLGNVEAESNYNPWRWQSEVILSSTDSRIGVLCGGNTAHAYGLCQSDPAANYIYRTVSQNAYGYGPNFSDSPGSQNDGSAQMVYLDWV